MIRKFKNIILILVAFITTLVVGNKMVVAAEIENSLNVASGNKLSEYISGLNFTRKTLDNRTNVYSLSLHKTNIENKHVNLYGECDRGLTYIIENAYPNKSITGDSDKDYYISQIAIWLYLDEVTGSKNISDEIKNKIYESSDIKNYVKNIVDEAKKVRKTGYPNPSVSINTTSNTLSIDNTKKYYISNTVKVDVKDAKEYSVKLINAPAGSFTKDLSGNEKQTFKAGEDFVVYVPASSVKNISLDFQVEVIASNTFKKTYEYRPDDSSIQEIVPTYLYETTKTASKKVNFNLFKSKVIINNLDKKTNKNIAGTILVIKDEKGNKVLSFKTTQENYIIENLPKGKYSLVEEEPTAGYELNKTPYEFTITSDKREITINYYNQKKVQKNDIVKIINLDEDTKKPLVGAKIVIKNEKGKVVKEFTSSIDYYTIDNLEPGKYTIEEIASPKGYIHNKNVQSFEVTKSNKEITLTLLSKAKTKVVTILIVDSNTKKPLKGAELVIRDEKGNEIARFSSKDKAYVIENIQNGTYYLEEISVPDGYRLNNEKIKFTISDDKISEQVVFENEQEKVTIIKVPETSSNAPFIFYIVGGIILLSTIGIVYYNGKKQDK